MGVYSFYDNELEDIILSNSLTKIESAVFYNNKIKDVNFPNNITSI